MSPVARKTVALLGFDRGGLVGLAQAFTQAQWVVSVDVPEPAQAPEAHVVVVLGADGVALLRSLAVVRARGFGGPVVGVGRLAPEQKAAWASGESWRVIREHEHPLDLHQGWAYLPGGQALVDADPAKVDPDLVVLAVSALSADTTEIDLISPEDASGLKAAAKALSAAVEAFAAVVRRDAALEI